MFEARVGIGISEKERLKLVFQEIQNLEEDIRKKSVDTSCKSNIFWWVNTLLNVTIIISAALITMLTAVLYSENIVSIVLGAIIFIISGINQLLKLGDRGYEYFKGTFRFRRIRQQVRDIIYMFQNYNIEQLLAYISSIRTELDEIDMDLYRASMTGEAKFDSGLRVVESSKTSNPIVSVDTPPSIPSNPEIHIHLETPNSSPNSSPKPSPRISKDSLEDNSLDVYAPGQAERFHQENEDN